MTVCFVFTGQFQQQWFLYTADSELVVQPYRRSWLWLWHEWYCTRR